jgi:hypothetical protein
VHRDRLLYAVERILGTAERTMGITGRIAALFNARFDPAGPIDDATFEDDNDVQTLTTRARAQEEGYSFPAFRRRGRAESVEVYAVANEHHSSRRQPVVRTKLCGHSSGVRDHHACRRRGLSVEVAFSTVTRPQSPSSSDGGSAREPRVVNAAASPRDVSSRDALEGVDHVKLSSGKAVHPSEERSARAGERPQAVLVGVGVATPNGHVVTTVPQARDEEGCLSARAAACAIGADDQRDPECWRCHSRPHFRPV